MKVNVCETSPVEEHNDELFIRVPATSIRGPEFCWLPGEAIDPVKKRMDENGKVARGSVFLVAHICRSDTIFACRSFITFPGGDMAATLGPPLTGSIFER